MADVSEWIPVGALGAAFEPAAHLLPASTGLAGRKLQIHFENGWLIEYRFSGASQLECTVRDGGQHGEPPCGGSITCSATEIRPNVYFVNFVESQRRAATTTLVLDLVNGICTLVSGQLPARERVRKPLFECIADREELTGVSARFVSGCIDGPFTAGTARHAPTADLVGRRVEYTYSPTERYEHVYLNERFFTWHCLAGSEKGLADTDRCHYRKLAPELYLFVWREKIVPTLGTVLIDFQHRKTTGRILGYGDFDFGAITNFPVGAHLRVLNSG